MVSCYVARTVASRIPKAAVPLGALIDLLAEDWDVVHRLFRREQ
jgi:hypothetical protein